MAEVFTVRLRYNTMLGNIKTDMKMSVNVCGAEQKDRLVAALGKIDGVETSWEPYTGDTLNDAASMIRAQLRDYPVHMAGSVEGK